MISKCSCAEAPVSGVRSSWRRYGNRQLRNWDEWVRRTKQSTPSPDIYTTNRLNPAMSNWAVGLDGNIPAGATD